MTNLIPLILIIIIATLIFKSLGKSDPAAEECAKEIIQLLRDKPNASAQDIAHILQSHNRTSKDAGDVTVIVKTRLQQTGILKEDQSEVMLRVREAKRMLDSES